MIALVVVGSIALVLAFVGAALQWLAKKVGPSLKRVVEAHEIRMRAEAKESLAQAALLHPPKPRLKPDEMGLPMRWTALRLVCTSCGTDEVEMENRVLVSDAGDLILLGICEDCSRPVIEPYSRYEVSIMLEKEEPEPALTRPEMVALADAKRNGPKRAPRPKAIKLADVPPAAKGSPGEVPAADAPPVPKASDKPAETLPKAEVHAGPTDSVAALPDLDENVDKNDKVH